MVVLWMGGWVGGRLLMLRVRACQCVRRPNVCPCPTPTGLRGRRVRSGCPAPAARPAAPASSTRAATQSAYSIGTQVNSAQSAGHILQRFVVPTPTETRLLVGQLPLCFAIHCCTNCCTILPSTHLTSQLCCTAHPRFMSTLYLSWPASPHSPASPSDQADQLHCPVLTYFHLIKATLS